MSVEQIQVVKDYMKARLSNDHEGVLKCVSDDIKLSSSRDGVYEGREKFEGYLKKCKPTGTWEEPQADPDNQELVLVKGKVKILLVSINVGSYFTFNSDNKIKTIEIKKN